MCRNTRRALMEMRERGPNTKQRLRVSRYTILGVPRSISLIRVP